MVIIRWRRRPAPFVVRHQRAALAVVLVCLVAGCGSGDRRSAQSPADARPTGTSSAGASPAHTADPSLSPAASSLPSPTPESKPGTVLDAVISALAEGNVPAVDRLLAFSPRACSSSLDPGAVPCPSGAPDGTVVNVVPAGSCEGGWLFEHAPPAGRVTGLRIFLGSEASANVKTYAVAQDKLPETDLSVGTKYYLIAGKVDFPVEGILIGVGEDGITFLS